MQYITKIFNTILLSVCAFLISFSFSTAVPVPAKFFVNTFEAQVGQVVEFELKVEGTESVPVYTIIANLEYDKNLLKYNSATAQPGWVTVSPDDVTDQNNGVIKRTAGYPSGLKQLSSIYKFNFTAINSGDAKVNVLGSSAYDANNNDLGLQNKSITVKIGGKKTEPEKEEVVPVKVVEEVKVAKKPQTVTLSFAGQTGLASDRDYSFVVKHNLKVTQETTGSTSVSVVDSNGLKVWGTTQDFRYNDSSEMLLTIPANSVAPGNYTLSIETNHDNQKTISKLTKDIGVVETTERNITQEKPVPYIPNYVYAICGFLILLNIFTLATLKSKKFRKFLKNF